MEEISAQIGADQADATLAREVFETLGMARGARPLERAELAGYLSAGLEKAALLLAAGRAQGKERPLAYLRTLVKELTDGGSLTADLAAKYLEGRAEKKPAGNKTPDALDYQQKRYTAEDIAHIFVNLDEEARP